MWNLKDWRCTLSTTRKELASPSSIAGMWLSLALLPIAQVCNAISLPDDRAGLIGSVKRLVETTYTASKPSRLIVVTSIYDRRGNIVEMQVALINKIQPEKESRRRAVITYDDTGRRIEDRIYQDDGGVTSRKVYSYDAHSRLVEKVEYRSENVVMTKWVYAYDDRGNEKEAKYYVKGRLIARYLYEYDEHGNKVKVVAFRGDGSEEHTAIHKYDEKNHSTESVVYEPGGAVDGKNTYRYNNRGYLTEEVISSADGSIIDKRVYSFEFDQKGNWVKRTVSTWAGSSGKLGPTQITERAISYYP